MQVNGHLDYMRQMDTILVAVGVPTKDHQGVSTAPTQPAAPAEGTVQTGDRPPSEDQRGKEGDGWDIPDISDLLDSLEESDAATQAASGSDALENTSNGDEAIALDAARPDSSEGAESGHVSWSWEEANWTMEHDNKWTERQEHPRL